MNCVPAQSPALQGARREVLDQHIGLGNEFTKNVLPGRNAQIERDGLLVACLHQPVARARCAAVTGRTAQGIAWSWLFDFDDFCAEIAKHGGGKRTGDQRADVEHADAGKGKVLAHECSSFGVLLRCLRKACLGDFLVGFEFASSPGNFFIGQLRDVAVIKFPACILAPVKRRLHGGAWTGCRFQQLQRELNGQLLRALITRPSGGVAKRKVAEQKARHTDGLDNVPGATHHDCGNTVGLKMTCNQTHGLVAYRSIGGENGDVRLVLANRAQDVDAILVDRCPLAAVGRRAVQAG